MIRGSASYCPKIEGNRDRAIDYFSRSCSKGDGWGCYELGKDAYDDKEAMQYYEQGCLSEKVCGPACTELGKIYRSGRKIRQDYKKALNMFEKACSLDDSEACILLAKMHENGKGSWAFPKTKAKRFYGKACDLGSLEGCENYKRLNQ